jgi:pimeloyl-ACP methyl ester carboxylesterase
MNFPAPGICAVEGMPRLPDSYREMGRIDTPTLLISGTFDGRTPPRNAEELLPMMPRARHLVVDGASHGLFGEAAVLTALLDFMRE